MGRGSFEAGEFHVLLVVGGGGEDFAGAGGGWFLFGFVFFVAFFAMFCEVVEGDVVWVVVEDVFFVVDVERFVALY